MPLKTNTLGIHQSGLIIRSALQEALNDLRKKPHLLSFIFAGLIQDNLTQNEYGQLEVDRAKKWFLSTDIPVLYNTRQDAVKMPCISIRLMQSVESDVTLGDIHYETHEPYQPDFQEGLQLWPALTASFEASYAPSTGLVTVPNLIGDSFIIANGQMLVDQVANKAYSILSTIDHYNFYIEKNVSMDFSNVVIKGEKPAYVVSVESSTFEETVGIGCHVQGEPIYLVYLYSIVIGMLQMYKQSLIESRNFERTYLRAMDEERNEAFENELIYSRYITITGFVRNYWPKAITQKISSVTSQLKLGVIGSTLPPQDKKDTSNDPWILDADPLMVGYQLKDKK